MSMLLHPWVCAAFNCALSLYVQLSIGKGTLLFAAGRIMFTPSRGSPEVR